MKEKQNWESGKPKLEIARRLRGIYFIEPEDEKCKEIIKNARNKLQVLQQLLLCFAKRRRVESMEDHSKNDDYKSRLTCILEAEESKRLRMEGSTPRIHEDNFVGILCSFAIWHTFSPISQAMKKYLKQKQQWTEYGKTLENISAWNLTKVRSKKEVIDEARSKDVKVQNTKSIKVEFYFEVVYAASIH